VVKTEIARGEEEGRKGAKVKNEGRRKEVGCGKEEKGNAWELEEKGRVEGGKRMMEQEGEMGKNEGGRRMEEAWKGEVRGRVEVKEEEVDWKR